MLENRLVSMQYDDDLYRAGKTFLIHTFETPLLLPENAGSALISAAMCIVNKLAWLQPSGDS